MTTVDANGKIVTSNVIAPQPAPLSGGSGGYMMGIPLTKPTPSVSKYTHILAAILASVAAFALTPAGQAIIAQYPHLAVVSGLVATLASLYKTPQAD